MGDRERLVALIDRLRDRYGYHSTVKPDELSDVDVRIWYEILSRRLRVFVEGEGAGWWPKRRAS